MTQPGASKHLRVLREVGLLWDRKAGKQRLYGLDARGLRPVHERTGGFERFWNESFDRLDVHPGPEKARRRKLMAAITDRKRRRSRRWPTARSLFSRVINAAQSWCSGRPPRFGTVVVVGPGEGSRLRTGCSNLCRAGEWSLRHARTDGWGYPEPISWTETVSPVRIVSLDGELRLI